MKKKHVPGKPLLSGGIKKAFRVYAAAVLAVTPLFIHCAPALASADPVQVVNNLSEFIFGLIRAIGLILLGFGIVQVGMSLKSHDPSQRANVRPDRVLFQ